MRIEQWKCFGRQAGQGNVALVVWQAPAELAWRQDWAAVQAAPACVFVDAAADGWVLDYYYPHQRSPLCLHATLAAAAALGAGAPLTVHTAWHGQALVLHGQAARHFVAVAPQPVATPALPLAQLHSLLAAPALVPVRPPQAASVGSPKLLVEVADVATLHGLRPDLPGILAWSRVHGINGLYVYCRRPDGDWEGRNFNHADAAREDSATGVAAGALTALLGAAVRLHQGAGRANPCLIETALAGDTILIGGRTERL